MRVKERCLTRTLRDLDRCRPSRIHFDGIRNAIPRHEVESINPTQPEFSGDTPGLRHRGLEQRQASNELLIVKCGENAAAVAIALRAEIGVTNQLAREPERDTTAIGRSKDERPGSAVYSLLQI